MSARRIAHDIRTSLDTIERRLVALRDTPAQQTPAGISTSINFVLSITALIRGDLERAEFDEQDQQ